MMVKTKMIWEIVIVKTMYAYTHTHTYIHTHNNCLAITSVTQCIVSESGPECSLSCSCTFFQFLFMTKQSTELWAEFTVDTAQKTGNIAKDGQHCSMLHSTSTKHVAISGRDTFAKHQVLWWESKCNILPFTFKP